MLEQSMARATMARVTSESIRQKPSDPHTSFSALGFDSIEGSWGPLLARYYEANRHELPNERAFWRTQAGSRPCILEIGAGSGFISHELAKAGAKTLILVEPEFENVKLLKKRLETEKWNIDPFILCERFEQVSIAPQDLIVFPYDSLPMITSRGDRLNLFKAVNAKLNNEGRFILHVSTKKWAERYINQFSAPQTSKHEILNDHIEVTRCAQKVSDDEYIKFVCIKSLLTGAQEDYAAKTSIIDSMEIMSLGASAGMALEQRFSDFFMNRDFLNADEDIFIFRKA